MLTCGVVVDQWGATFGIMTQEVLLPYCRYLICTKTTNPASSLPTRLPRTLIGYHPIAPNARAQFAADESAPYLCARADFSMISFLIYSIKTMSKQKTDIGQY